LFSLYKYISKTKKPVKAYQVLGVAPSISIFGSEINTLGLKKELSFFKPNRRFKKN